MQGKFLVCRTTDNRLRTTDFWAVADCSLLSVDCSHQKNRKFDVVSPASPLYPPFIGGYLGVVGPLGFQRRRRFSESTSLQDNKWAIAGCFKTTRPRVYKTTSKVVADGFKTTSQRVNKTTSKVVAVLPFYFRLLSFTLCRSTTKSTRSLVVFWICSLQLKTMRFTGRKYGSYGSKLWHLGCVSVGVWDSQDKFGL